ncbi:Phosphopantetheine adenylyltransferase [Corynebacterium kalinowskii]|uniref:Phosphopantetheine adenylyltransferase n=1 Tax=Corynebacterium kalinowskii TaxID=2675216 RepID=A0A6B8VCL6_9CORY|nr:pantetheine-phosphate adenylyltransferase [Corynebacterium kalinowskii]QGU01873.1 Phosphopantetheine adenylyltransferase [Corynebacterium kalinowskii]
MRVACPGSFDPITLGHLNIIERSAALYEEVVVLVTYNPSKSGMFNADERVELISSVVSHLSNVTVDTWSGLLVDYTTAHDIPVLVKGLRSSLDYEYELPMAQMNKRLSGVETNFLMTDPELGYISSTLCKEVAKFGGSLDGLLPPVVVDALLARLRQ